MKSSRALSKLSSPVRPVSLHSKVLVPPAGGSSVALAVSAGSSNVPTHLPLIAHAHASCTQVRWSSYTPMGSGSGSSLSSQEKKKQVTIKTIQNMYRKGEPIAMLTAHDFPSAAVADSAGIDAILVGDSLAMVALGMKDTSAVTLEDMILHSRSVTSAARSAFVVGDLPMGSYEVSPQQAVQSAIRLVKEAYVHAIKLEGGKDFAPAIKAVATAGIPVVAHIGLTPQRQHALGGFSSQGKSVSAAFKILEDAYAVQEAGAFMIVLEAIPAEIAAIITQKLRVPTIGIGAGNGCSGQILVQTDMAGNFEPGRHLPKFVKKYANVWTEAKKGIEQYRAEVKNKEYPTKEYTYAIDEDRVVEFKKLVDKQSSE